MDVTNLLYGVLTLSCMDTGQFVPLTLAARKHLPVPLALETHLPIPLPLLAPFACPHISGTGSAQLTPLFSTTSELVFFTVRMQNCDLYLKSVSQKLLSVLGKFPKQDKQV